MADSGRSRLVAQQGDLGEAVAASERRDDASVADHLGPTGLDSVLETNRWRRDEHKEPMAPESDRAGVYLQPNGKYTVCVRIGGKPRFRTVDASTVAEARHQRALLSAAARSGELVLIPMITFAEVSARWLAEFEAEVAAGTRRERTLELYRNQLERHLLPRLGQRRLQLITTDELAELIAALQAQRLAAWTVRGIMVPLGCVFSFALRRGHLVENPLRRLEADERPRPGPRQQRVLTQDELRRLFAACPISPAIARNRRLHRHALLRSARAQLGGY
jgi:Phage integrase, N-terminal SAM-like domain